jgi:23S rRNA pseudouridine2605 synthase
MQERLQKLIARAGVTSRRHAEELILAGAVTVNGRVVTELGSKADAARDHIKVNGKLLRFSGERVYLALHKPAECVATMHDPEGREDLSDWLHGVRGRVFPVGRLDYHADGLLLLTNDGDFAAELLRGGRLPQTYRVKTRGQLDGSVMQGLRERFRMDLRPIRTERSSSDSANFWYQVRVVGARADVLRQALEQHGHPVRKLRRVAIGPVELGALAPGEFRKLTPQEVHALRRELRAAATRAGNGREVRPALRRTKNRRARSR